mmetsp:Transcript_40031/g.113444  ORF Transcript_40031/g.113444 Transcript_40031/m.113444 type:complete len:227 (-) Transcript_40031:168-848(-)
MQSFSHWWRLWCRRSLTCGGWLPAPQYHINQQEDVAKASRTGRGSSSPLPGQGRAALGSWASLPCCTEIQSSWRTSWGCGLRSLRHRSSRPTHGRQRCCTRLPGRRPGFQRMAATCCWTCTAAPALLACPLPVAARRCMASRWLAARWWTPAPTLQGMASLTPNSSRATWRRCHQPLRKPFSAAQMSSSLTLPAQACPRRSSPSCGGAGHGGWCMSPATLPPRCVT